MNKLSFTAAAIVILAITACDGATNSGSGSRSGSSQASSTRVIAPMDQESQGPEIDG